MNPKELRIVFMGTPAFAVESLKALVENQYRVVAVITAPDKPSGRGQKVSETAVKKYAMSAGIPVMQPEKLKNPAFLQELQNLQADLQIVVAFRMLPELVWDMPPMGTFNLHASLLPQYRGAAPINRAVMNGEKETGVTTFLLSHEIDTGKILFSERTPIGDHETAGDLHDRLMVVGAKLVLRTVDALADGSSRPVPQEHLLAGNHEIKHAPKLFRENMEIDWNRPAEEVRNLIRGLSPSPAAWTTFTDGETNRRVEAKIYYAEPATEEPAAPGTLRTDGKNYLMVACANGWLNITDLQLAGKKRMGAGEFLRGFQNAERYRLG
jgi:methionyl-tRNA formyltransferase